MGGVFFIVKNWPAKTEMSKISANKRPVLYITVALRYGCKLLFFNQESATKWVVRVHESTDKVLYMQPESIILYAQLKLWTPKLPVPLKALGGKNKNMAVNRPGLASC